MEEAIRELTHRVLVVSGAVRAILIVGTVTLAAVVIAFSALWSRLAAIERRIVARDEEEAKYREKIRDRLGPAPHPRVPRQKPIA